MTSPLNTCKSAVVDLLKTKNFLQYRTDTREPTEKKKFPDGFKFGTATGAYQIEGAWNAADKTPSIWDTFCHQTPSPIKDGTNGDDACKSYEFYKRDVKMLKFLGVDFYRFSISWPRVLPNGFANNISKEGSKYYNDLINELLANGIEPAITIYHWDLPQNLQDLGGWANPLIAEWFEDYARVLFQLYGDRVKTWITINEPKQIVLFGYGTGSFAPGVKMIGTAEYISAKNLVMANARAWRLYDTEFRPTQKGTCGIVIAANFCDGASPDPDDIDAGLDAIEFEIGMYSHPIFTDKGGVPERVVKRVAKKSMEQGFPRSRLPEFTDEEKEFVKGTSDFFGFNHYFTKFYTRTTWKEGKFPVPSYHDDLGAIGSHLDEAYNLEKGYVPHVTVLPEGIRAALNWIKDSYKNPPVMIFENGFCTYNGIEDQNRISYHRRYLNAILQAIDEDKCDVRCYTAWSLMDNFEWDSGFSPKFGLFEVEDGEEKTRKPRLSAFWYRNLVSKKLLDPESQPVVEDLTF